VSTSRRLFVQQREASELLFCPSFARPPFPAVLAQPPVRAPLFDRLERRGPLPGVFSYDSEVFRCHALPGTSTIVIEPAPEGSFCWSFPVEGSFF